jgi:hypothetical protein
MRQLRELLRLRLQAEVSMRQIKASLRISLGAVQKVISQAEAQGLSWAAIEQLDDQQLARRQAVCRLCRANGCPSRKSLHFEILDLFVTGVNLESFVGGPAKENPEP